MMDVSFVVGVDGIAAASFEWLANSILALGSAAMLQASENKMHT